MNLFQRQSYLGGGSPRIRYNQWFVRPWAKSARVRRRVPQI